MEEKDILRALELPRATHVLRNFPFNRLAPRLTVKDKKFFQKVVEAHGVRLLATINTRTTNIPVHEDDETAYQEIHFFQIRIKESKWTRRIYKILAEAMPYPLFIRFVAGDKSEWIGAIHQKIEKTGLLKMQKVYSTNPGIDEGEYLKSWSFEQNDKYHLKGFYENLLKQIVRIELKDIYGYDAELGLAEGTAHLEAIHALDKEIASCIKRAKKEPQMNKRIEWQMEANKLKIKREKMIKGEI